MTSAWPEETCVLRFARERRISTESIRKWHHNAGNYSTVCSVVFQEFSTSDLNLNLTYALIEFRAKLFICGRESCHSCLKFKYNAASRVDLKYVRNWLVTFYGIKKLWFDVNLSESHQLVKCFAFLLWSINWKSQIKNDGNLVMKDFIWISIFVLLPMIAKVGTLKQLKQKSLTMALISVTTPS